MENKITPKQALENLYELASPYNKPDLYSANNNYQIIEQALDEHEKQTQILEVLKNKKVDIADLWFDIFFSENHPQNNVSALDYYNANHINLTETEFNLIKEWLK